MDAKYFPKNYHESRQQFRELSQKLKAETGEWKIPGKKDDDLYVDHAYWPALEKPEFLLVVTSGIHGSETYAGSAIIKMFMSEIFPKVNRKTTGIFLVHALNPYGFKHHQRTTESGVNLNRNFSVSGQLYKSKNPDSAKYHDRFFAKKPVDSERSDLMKVMQKKDGLVYFDDVSLDQFTKAVAPGQFDTPAHHEYGGTGLEPQTKLLIEKIKVLMPQYKDVVGLDLHTGLGDKNRLHLLTSGSGKDLHPDLFAKLFHEKEDKDIYTFTPATTEGFYEVWGPLNTMFVDLAGPQHRVCTITMEFGTFGHSLDEQLESLNTSMLSQQGRFYGFASEDLKNKIMKEDFERSYPQKDEWRNAVVAASRGLFERILKRAGQLTA